MHLVGSAFEPGEEAAYAVPDILLPFAFAVDHPGAFGIAQVAPGRIHGDGAFTGEFQKIRLALFIGFGLPGLDGPLAKTQGRIRYDKAIIHADAAAEPAAGLAGTGR